MQYIGGGTEEAGCIFCNRLAANDDVASLILFRAEHAFGIMNLFPYNTGHLMLVPNEHVASPESADPATLAELGSMLRPTLRAVRRALGCHGFNIGYNVGPVAGAGIADHVHQHVVPRWSGDANFLPVLASTKVLPELIPVTYAKIRAELRRELASQPAGVASVRVVVPAHDDSAILVRADAHGLRLPVASPAPDEPIWRAALLAVEELPGGKQIAGWAGPARTDAPGPTALGLELIDKPDSVPAGWHVLPVDQAASLADPTDQQVLSNLIESKST